MVAFLVGLMSGIAGTLCVDAIRMLAKNRSRLRLLCATRLRRSEPVRVSAAYLFRLRVESSYLLIKGDRIRSQYQPIGGVYKRFPSSDNVFNELDVRLDSSIKPGAGDSDDLRVRLPRKNLLEFIDWFDSRQGREVDLSREFYEELDPLDVLSREDRSSFKPEFIRQCNRKLSYSRHFDVNELLLHDVYEVKLSDESQRLVSEYTRRNPGGDLILVDSDDIDRGTCYVNGAHYTIADTARAVK